MHLISLHKSSLYPTQVNFMFSSNYLREFDCLYLVKFNVITNIQQHRTHFVYTKFTEYFQFSKLHSLFVRNDKNLRHKLRNKKKKPLSLASMQIFILFYYQSNSHVKYLPALQYGQLNMLVIFHRLHNTQKQVIRHLKPIPVFG